MPTVWPAFRSADSIAQFAASGHSVPTAEGTAFWTAVFSTDCAASGASSVSAAQSSAQSPSINSTVEATNSKAVFDAVAVPIVWSNYSATIVSNSCNIDNSIISNGLINLWHI